VTTVARDETVLVHQVRLVHATTGEPIALSDARLVTPPRGWWVRMSPPWVVVGARSDLTAVAAPPVLEVVLADGVLADLLQLPAPVAGQPPRSVRVPLTGPTVEVTLDPQPMTLTVVLTATGTGDPSSGRTPSVSGSAGPPIQLTETAELGTYRSDPVVWDHAHSPGELLVGATTVRKVGVDVRRSDTRLHVVDPT